MLNYIRVVLVAGLIGTATLAMAGPDEKVSMGFNVDRASFDLLLKGRPALPKIKSLENKWTGTVISRYISDDYPYQMALGLTLPMQRHKDNQHLRLYPALMYSASYSLNLGGGALRALGGARLTFAGGSFHSPGVSARFLRARLGPEVSLQLWLGDEYFLELGAYRSVSSWNLYQRDHGAKISAKKETRFSLGFGVAETPEYDQF